MFVGLYYNLSGLGTRFDIGWYVFCSFAFYIHFSFSKLLSRTQKNIRSRNKQLSLNFNYLCA